MSEELVRELVIARCEARAFEVLKGQLFRVIAIEGKQVGDMTLLSLHDFQTSGHGVFPILGDS